MKLDEDLRVTHLDLSSQDLQFRQLACMESAFLDRSWFESLNSNQNLLKYNLQPWPTFIGQQKLNVLKTVSLEICNLIRSIPQKIFAGNPQEICKFYNLSSPAFAEILLTPPHGIDASVARGDLIDTRDGFKCIEFNFTPNLGGWETSVIAGMHMDVPATAEFIRNLGASCSYTHTMRRFFLHVLEDVCSKGNLEVRELNVAFVFDDVDLASAENVAATRGYLEGEIAGACEEKGLKLQGRVFFCRQQDLGRKQGAVVLNGSRVHAVVEFSTALTSISVYRAYKAGAVSLFNGPIEPILSSKKNIGLLSEHESSDVFSPEEREQIRRYIPWSRRVVPGPADFHGEKVSMEELLDNLRTRLVLKEADSCGGKGVALGQFTSASEWSELARTALVSGNYIVQEKLESLPYLYQAGDFGCAVHDVIWGPFIFGQTYGGVILRMQPKAAGGAVNLSLSATEGIVFEV